MTHRDRPWGPERRLSKAFGQRRARLAMSRIATPHAPCRKPWKAVPMSHYYRSLVLPLRQHDSRQTPTVIFLAQVCGAPIAEETGVV
jgi:hypothetical protein